MSEPKRIQRSRAKGWRLPEGAVVCTRPTKWGNPFTAAVCRQLRIRSFPRADAPVREEEVA